MDQDALYSQLRILLENLNIRQQTGRHGQTLMQTKHDPTRIALEYVTFMTRLLE